MLRVSHKMLMMTACPLLVFLSPLPITSFSTFPFSPSFLKTNQTNKSLLFHFPFPLFIFPLHPPSTFTPLHLCSFSSPQLRLWKQQGKVQRGIYRTDVLVEGKGISIAHGVSRKFQWDGLTSGLLVFSGRVQFIMHKPNFSYKMQNVKWTEADSFLHEPLFRS